VRAEGKGRAEAAECRPFVDGIEGYPNTLRVLVVEGDAMLREALIVALSAEYEVRALMDWLHVEEMLSDFRPSLVVLDVDRDIGRPNSFTLARRLIALHAVPTIFLSAAGGLDPRLNGFDAGTDGCIPWPLSSLELQARVRAVLRRSESDRVGSAERSMLRFADVEADEDARMVHRGGKQLELTRRERDLLLTFLEHPGRVLSRTQLLMMVWGFEHYNANVVEVYVSSLRRKLEEHGTRLIQTIRGVGYVLRV